MPEANQPLPAWHFAAPGAPDSGHLLSPDGNKLAWSGTSWLRRRLFIRNLVTGEVRSWRVTGSVIWTGDSRRLVYAGDTSGTENTHVYVIDTESSSGPVDLTPYSGVRAAIHQVVESDPVNILVAHNRRNPRLSDLYRINLETRAETLVAANPGNAVAPITRADGALQGWQPSREALRPVQEKERPQAERAPDIAARKDEFVRVLGAGKMPRVVWALSNRGRDRTALVELDLGRGWEHVVFEDLIADVSSAYIGRATHEPLSITAHPAYPRVEIPDSDLRAALDPVIRQFSGEPYGLEVESGDRTDRRLIVRAYSATQNEAWLVDRERRSAESLGRGVPPTLEESLVPMRAVTFPARDGLVLKGFLTMPRSGPRGNLPLVLMVHGGPWLRSVWIDPMRSEESARVQFLANRGYAVLQVDFRGSSGYGRTFQKAGMGELGKRMQDDLIDAVEWATKNSIADPSRIAIMGHSYGGYAALSAMAAYPHIFACGISIAGPTDLASMIESFPPYWTVDLSNWHDFLGNPKVPADREEMNRRSPISNVASIERPVLIIHGDRDVRVHVDQSRRMKNALAAAGKPVQFIAIAQMGHTPSWWAHQYQVLRHTERFLGTCLGGQARLHEWPDPLIKAWMWLSQ